MNHKTIFGVFIKVLGILIIFLPPLLFFLGFYAGIALRLPAIMAYAVIASFILLIPCNFIGQSLYKAGLSIQMGTRSKEELRKSIEELVASKEQPAPAKKPARKKKKR